MKFDYEGPDGEMNSYFKPESIGEVKIGSKTTKGNLTQ
jgi:hypothetical protein